MTCFAVYLKLLDGSIAQIVDALCAQKSYDSVRWYNYLNDHEYTIKV